MKKCAAANHLWQYPHAVYAVGYKGSCIRRWCSRCLCQQVGDIPRWRAERKDEFDHPPVEDD